MSNLRLSSVADNLRAVADLLSLTPWRTVQDALDALKTSPEGIAPDLLPLAGPDACEAIEAELLALAWREAA
jgi:hypothetical protein